MTTDEERREVAAKLRKNAENCPNMSLILNVAFSDGALRPDGAMDWTVTAHDAAMRLADLIEPDEGHFAEDDKMVDRDALLALADDLDQRTKSWLDIYGGDYALKCVARSIRNACGNHEERSES